MSALDPALRAGAWAAGSDAPEKTEVKIGFIPLTDCASVVIASVMKFDEKYGIKIVPTQGSVVGGGARQARQRRARRRARALRPHLRRADGHRRTEEGHGRADEPQHNGQAITLSNQLKDKGAVDGAEAQGADRQGKARVHVRADVSHRHARDVDLLLARDLRHQSVDGREDDHRAAAADGGEHARRQHGRLLRRRALGQPRDLRQDRLHRGDHAGHLEGSSGEDARHDRGIRPEISRTRRGR